MKNYVFNLSFFIEASIIVCFYLGRRNIKSIIIKRYNSKWKLEHKVEQDEHHQVYYIYYYKDKENVE